MYSGVDATGLADRVDVGVSEGSIKDIPVGTVGNAFG